MPVQYVSVEDAIAASGLRMVVVGNVPSPWGEAAKGILHIKAIDWVAVRLVYDSEPLSNGPASAAARSRSTTTNRRGRAGRRSCCWPSGWRPTPSLMPADAAERATMFGLAHEICGEDGLGWARRLQLVHAGLQKPAASPSASRSTWRKNTATPRRPARPPARA